MSGTYRHLAPGRYQLVVENGEGPAGVRRPDGRDVIVGIEGGSQSFSIPRDERVYYWWRGPTPRQGVRLAGASKPAERRLAGASTA